MAQRFSTDSRIRKMTVLLLGALFFAQSHAEAFYHANRKRTLSRPGSVVPQVPRHFTILQDSAAFSLPSRNTRISTIQSGSFLDDFTILTARSTKGVIAPFWQPLASFALNLLQPVVKSVTDLSRSALDLISIPAWSTLTDVQRIGEVSFFTLVMVALLQGGIAVFQYRNNPSGELMVPPGPTIGTELPDNDDTKAIEQKIPSPSETATFIRAGSQIESIEHELDELTSNESGGKLLKRINKLLVLLAPWLADRASLILQRNAHLWHIGSILTLTSIFDLPQSYMQRLRRRMSRNIVNSSETKLSLFEGEKAHLLVIGDSLAVGLGTVNRFDVNKTNDWPFQRIENIDESTVKRNSPSPAFPKSLAQTLAKELQKPVTWRSAGVDGGDIPNIRKFCLGVVDEEVEAGRQPDAVVILCGVNDMKYCLSNPFKKSNWPRSFRSRLKLLIEDIRSKAPETTVIVPAMPTQSFHKNSPLNVFPLGLLLDTMVGFWDSQKKLVVDGFDIAGVQYVGLSPMEISRWYDKSEYQDLGDDVDAPITLLAIDGVHPNTRCYSKWAEAIGVKVISNLQPRSEET